jgi:membrane protease YdiL (CAAX protease family)
VAWVGFVGAAVAVVAACRAQRVPLLPTDRPEPPPIRGELVFAAVLLLVVVPGLMGELLTWSGFFTSLYGPSPADTPLPKTDPRRSLEQIWTAVLAAPVQAAGLLGLLALGGARPRRLGLTGRRAGADLAAGYVTWAVVTPAVFGVYALARYLHTRLTGSPPELHTLERAAENPILAADRVVFVLSAVVTAPMVEELLFRGLILGGMLRYARGPDLGVVLAVALGALTMWVEGHGLLTNPAPVLFPLALVPVYFALGPLAAWLRPAEGAPVPPAQAARAVFSSALVFAQFHAAVWPTPVPLFLLGLALAWLAYRTGSLLGPMVTHGLFNAVSCVELFLRR